MFHFRLLFCISLVYFLFDDSANLFGARRVVNAFVCDNNRYNLEENDFYLNHPNKIVYAIQRNTSGLFLIARKYQTSVSLRILPQNSSRLFVHSCNRVDVIAYGGNETDRFIFVHRLEFCPDTATFAHTIFHHSYNSQINLNSVLYTPLSDGYYTPIQCVGYFAWSSPDWLCKGAVAAIPQMCSNASLYKKHSYVCNYDFVMKTVTASQWMANELIGPYASIACNQFFMTKANDRRLVAIVPNSVEKVLPETKLVCFGAPASWRQVNIYDCDYDNGDEGPTQLMSCKDMFSDTVVEEAKVFIAQLPFPLLILMSVMMFCAVLAATVLAVWLSARSE